LSVVMSCVRHTQSGAYLPPVVCEPLEPKVFNAEAPQNITLGKGILRNSNRTQTGGHTAEGGAGHLAGAAARLGRGGRGEGEGGRTVGLVSVHRGRGKGAGEDDVTVPVPRGPSL